MEINNPYLFVEINDTHLTFIAISSDANENFRVIQKVTSNYEGIKNNKFVNLDQTNQIIKKDIEIIEDKLDYVFKEVIIVLDNFKYLCTNISGFKKLNGSQVLKENISYILNSLKLNVTENEKEKTVLHIFNSESVLDGTKVENLPIGLFGNFYNHVLTFFMVENNDLKNIKQIFNKNNVKIKKFFIKDFIEGAQLINQNHDINTFFKIKIKKTNSNLSFFDKSALRYIEYFDFGSNIILKDIEKVCAVSNEFVKKVLQDQLLKNGNFEENQLIDKKYFLENKYRKITKKLILDIVKARIEEIANLILNSNVNIKTFKKKIEKIYIVIEDELISNNFEKNLEFNFSKNNNIEPHVINGFKIEDLTRSAVHLTLYGWKTEAIPLIQTKKSLITKIFKTLFG